VESGGGRRCHSSWIGGSLGEIDVESLLSHRLTLDEVNRGFELMEAQDGIRSVILFDQ
jgi:Zn-dependent alcohol dehydrogenase